ncbi:nitric oxide synthase, endothelial-like [Actinia tenebrosa]|uniref:nitric-oxide synthase (NADPH) n=1 Tax=Actinia tenebrosa TaxID=6105 RepID=A0A6P8HDU9_ACTTE|nr:nitric oxide synthase, endothelial-like [Actinia tenebrosa]
MEHHHLQKNTNEQITNGQAISTTTVDVKTTNEHPENKMESNKASPLTSPIRKCPFTGTLRETSKTPKIIKLKNWETGKETIDTLHQKAKIPLNCTPARCEGSLMRPYGGEVAPPRAYGIPRPKEEVAIHAEDFIEQYYTSMKM